MSLARAHALDVVAIHLAWKRTHAPANTMNLNEEITPAEHEFGEALDRYKRENRRMNLQSSEVLAVAVALGYRQVAVGRTEVVEIEVATVKTPGGKATVLEPRRGKTPTAQCPKGRRKGKAATHCRLCSRPL